MADPQTTRYPGMDVRLVRDESIGVTISGTEYVLSLTEAINLHQRIGLKIKEIYDAR